MGTGRSIGWFTTGRDAEAVSLLETILKGIEAGSIEGSLAYIAMNRERGEGTFSDRIIDLGREQGITCICLSSDSFEPELRRKGRTSPQIMAQWRHRFHHELLQRMNGHVADFVVLAGYMLIVSPEMCQALHLINLHPAPPGGPAGTWQEVIWKLIRMRAQESGVLIHLVTPELDKGPPIAYCIYRIRDGELDEGWHGMDERLAGMSIHDIMKQEGEENLLFRMIRSEGVRREVPLLFETIRWLCSGRLNIEGERVYCDGREYPGGVCLTEEVERIIAGRD
ncbi:MAG: phosphoribosylglycinamide formyltransferase [bacterium]